MGGGKTPNRSTALENTAPAPLFRTLRSKSLLGRARQPLGAGNHCSGVLRSHLALEIAARASFFVFDSTRKHRLGAASSHVPLEMTAQVCSAATGRSKSLLGHASKPCSARNHGSNRLFFIRPHFRFSFEIPFEIAVLRIVHCFELCFVRLHRHRKVPYANLVY